VSSTAPRILITTAAVFSCEARHEARVRAVAAAAEIRIRPRDVVTADDLAWAQIVLGWPPREHLARARDLVWLHLPSAGADRYADRSLFARPDLVLTNSRGVFGQPIAEHVIALMLAWSRGLHLYMRQQQAADWERLAGVGRDFAASTVGVIGLGSIGTEVARRAAALGATVLAVKRRPAERPPFVAELTGEEGLDGLLRRSDYVVLALPSTHKTQKALSRERIASIKPGAFLVNIGRGALVDQDALIEALQAGRLGGAGLDVTSPEPLPPESPLWHLSNVIITPHASGSSPTNDDRRFEIFCRNLGRFVAGQALENIVDFEEGY
jgi:phosphoglycerate dehydrogenase-like enzyme